MFDVWLGVKKRHLLLLLRDVMGQKMQNAIYHRYFSHLDSFFKNTTLLFNIWEGSVEFSWGRDWNCQLDSELFWWWWCSWWLHLFSLGLGCRGATSLQITRNKSLWPLPWICALLSKEHLKLTKMTSPRYPAAAAHEHLRLLHLPRTPAPERSLLCCHRFLCV